MELLSSPQNPGDGFAVLHLAAHHPLHGPAERNQPAGNALIVLGLGLSAAQAARSEQRHGFIEKAWAGVIVQGGLPLRSRVAGLLQQLALGGLERALAFVDAARRQLPEFAVGGIAILLDQQHRGLRLALIEGENDHRAGMPDDVPPCAHSRGLDDLIAGHVEDAGGVHDLRGEDLNAGLRCIPWGRALKGGALRVTLLAWFCHGQKYTGFKVSTFKEKVEQLKLRVPHSSFFCLSGAVEFPWRRCPIFAFFWQMWGFRVRATLRCAEATDNLICRRWSAGQWAGEAAARQRLHDCRDRRARRTALQAAGGGLGARGRGLARDALDRKACVRRAVAGGAGCCHRRSGRGAGASAGATGEGLAAHGPDKALSGEAD